MESFANRERKGENGTPKDASANPPMKRSATHLGSQHLPLAILALVLTPFLNPSSLLAQQRGQDPLLQWMDQIAQEQLQRREAAQANIRSVADAERRKQVVRQTILSLLGGLPEYSGPLNPRTTGTINSDGYVIEKVIFESLPGFYVTANLYRPSGPRSEEHTSELQSLRHLVCR